jgi:hypothetical protein
VRRSSHWTRRDWLWAGLLSGLSCSDGSETPGDTEAPAAPEAMTHRFSFVVIADPHIAGPEDHETRLQTVVSWINEQAESRDLQLVLVLGDIGWGEGLPTSLDLLGALEIPWVPIIGDNVIINGEDAVFAETFADQYADLAQTLDAWERSSLPVWDPNYEVEAYLQNMRFEHEGVLFLGLDLNLRGVGGIAGEFAELHDFDGGTWPFVIESLEGAGERPDESIIILSHIPLMAGALSVEEVEQVNNFSLPLADKIHAAYAGHMHVTYDLYNEPGGYEVMVTDATWDDENTIRVVEVLGNDEGFSYVQEMVELK